MKKKRKIKRCCKNKKNRVSEPSSNPNLIVEVCKKCGCKHRRFMVDPGMLGVVGKNLGR